LIGVLFFFFRGYNWSSLIERGYFLFEFHEIALLGVGTCIWVLMVEVWQVMDWLGEQLRASWSSLAEDGSMEASHTRHTRAVSNNWAFLAIRS